MKDLKKIINIVESDLDTVTHKTYNEKLLKGFKGNAHTENIVFSMITLIVVEHRESDKEYNFLDEDWYDLVQDFRPIAQLFAVVNDLVVIDWGGRLEECIIDFIKYKLETADGLYVV